MYKIIGTKLSYVNKVRELITSPVALSLRIGASQSYYIQQISSYCENTMDPKECSNASTAMKTTVTSPHIYKPVGPYSQAILAEGKTLYVSGLLGLDKDGQMVSPDAGEQARKALSNMQHVLEAGGASMDSVVKTTILLGDIQSFQAVNKVYGEFFTSNCPARATFQVGKLPLGAAVEIECIALSGQLVLAEAGPCPCSRN